MADATTASQPTIIPCGETARRRNLKAIKAMYGINEYAENSRTPFYGNDRAAKRRRLIGSEMDIGDKVAVDPDDIHAGCLAKPLPGVVVDSKVDVEQPLNEANKGFRLLQNMGWKEGTGLGKGEQGRQEPDHMKMMASENERRNALLNFLAVNYVSAESIESKFQVKSTVSNQRLGLGAKDPKPASKIRKNAILNKTRERYNKITFT